MRRDREDHDRSQRHRSTPRLEEHEQERHHRRDDRQHGGCDQGGPAELVDLEDACEPSERPAGLDAGWEHGCSGDPGTDATSAMAATPIPKQAIASVDDREERSTEPEPISPRPAAAIMAPARSLDAGYRLREKEHLDWTFNL